MRIAPPSKRDFSSPSERGSGHDGISVGLPIMLLRPWHKFSPGVVPIMTWAGLRGGISIGLALSLPLSPQRDLVIGATYMVVILSVLVQGMTLERVIAYYRP